MSCGILRKEKERYEIVSITRVGSSQKYASGWDQAFSGKKKSASGRTTTARKKTATKKSSKPKAAAKKKKR
jgi:hypothetical protein